MRGEPCGKKSYLRAGQPTRIRGLTFLAASDKYDISTYIFLSIEYHQYDKYLVHWYSVYILSVGTVTYPCSRSTVTYPSSRSNLAFVRQPENCYMIKKMYPIYIYVK